MILPCFDFLPILWNAGTFNYLHSLSLKFFICLQQTHLSKASGNPIVQVLWNTRHTLFLVFLKLFQKYLPINSEGLIFPSRIPYHFSCHSQKTLIKCIRLLPPYQNVSKELCLPPLDLLELSDLFIVMIFDIMFAFTLYFLQLWSVMKI